MGTFLRVVSHDQLFYQQARTDPIIINQFQENTKEARKAFREKIYTLYHPQDTLNNAPRCECPPGQGLKERKYLGVVCELCNKPVMNVRDQKLESLVWLKSPNGVAKLINPIVWIILSNHFKKGRFNVVHYLCDTRYPKPDKPPKIFAALDAMNITRGYNYFVRNFFTTFDSRGNVIGPGIIEKLLTISDFRKKKQENPHEVHHILRFLEENRDKLFSDYLALPNKTLLVVEDTDMSMYVDSNVPVAIDAIDSLIGIDDPLNGFSLEVRQNRVIRGINQMSMYYQDFNKKSFSSKEGISRKHLAATRCDWSFRAVITSLTDDHRHRELHIPWGIGIGLLRLHLASKLQRRGWLPNEIFRFLSRYANEYNPLLDELFKELIAESRFPGLPTVFQRNPSLGLGSMQLFYITQVKTDADDPTVSLSILTVRSFNADFDGKLKLLSLNFFNCWKLLRAWLATTWVERPSVNA